MEFNGGSSSNTQYGVEKLVGTNYRYWRMCMRPFFKSRRKWKIKCGKALFALRTSINKEFIDHVRDVSSPKEVWDTLERLFSKKNTTRLQFLENELAISKQEGMSISEYFLRIKNICAEISELDPKEKISDARLRQFLIRGLKMEYTPFITSIQGWEKQPSVEELESLLSNQEALAKQMAKNSNSERDDVLFSKAKFSEGITNEKKSNGNSPQGNKSFKCYRCRKLGHIKRNCPVKLSKANIACDEDEDDRLNWEQCFTTEVIEGRNNIDRKSAPNQTAVNYVKDEWIIDSGCSHHVTGNDSLFSELHKHNGERVIVTADNSTYGTRRCCDSNGIQRQMTCPNTP
uniref:CCHC-type domain-containing protein n=1 Tax=Nelumbo nucifera TaxID=4432 RepID=A0A822XJ42_NELNU|nr:TPA_asm: hypothetical protein HUJ06_021186 [Nelumbo nucifera]